MLDRAAIAQHLKLLGKDPLSVRIRAFPHKDSKRKAAIKARKAGGINPVELEQWQREGRGIYLVVNDGGDKKEQITRCVAHFCEWDNKPLEWQVVAWQELGLPEPTFMVSTGGRSIHCYWVLTTPTTREAWEPLQARLVAHAGSDQVVKDPSRVLRLAGCSYIGADDQPQGQVEIIHVSGITYTAEQLAACLPPEQQQTQQPGPDPDWQPIYLDDGQPANLSPRGMDQIRAALECIPQRFSGSYELHRQVLWGLVAAVQEAGGTFEQAIALMEAHSPSKTCGWDIEQVARSGDGSVKAGTFWHHAESHGYDLSTPKPEPSSWQAQPLGDEGLPLAREQLQAQLSNLRASIDLRLILPPKLADLLIARAEAFPVHPSALLGPLLTAVASVLGTRVEARVNATWTEPMVVWAGNILPPSGLKSPVTKVFERPLLDLQKEAIQSHAQAVRDKVEGEPDPSPARRYIVQDATLERIAQIQAEPASFGLLSNQDELAAWFERLRLASAAGARATWLSLWSGGAAIVDRKVSASSFCDTTSVSLFGNVQPDKLAAMVNGDGDGVAEAGDGLWARFLWCRPPQIPWVYRPDGFSIRREIRALLRTLDTVPTPVSGQPLEVRFSRQVAMDIAAPEWERWHRLAEESAGPRAAFLGKLRGYSVRLAALLQLISDAELCQSLDRTMAGAAKVDAEGGWFVELSAAAMIAGLTLSEFYLAQFDALQPELAQAGASDLPPLVAKFLRRVEERGVSEVSLRTLQQWRLNGRDPLSAEECLQLLRSIAETYGHGRIESEKRRGGTTWVWRATC